jgi:hypothetical protein
MGKLHDQVPGSTAINVFMALPCVDLRRSGRVARRNTALDPVAEPSADPNRCAVGLAVAWRGFIFGSLLSRGTAARRCSVLPMAQSQIASRIDTVHGVKGDEADAVLMLIPDKERTDELAARRFGGSPNSDVETEEALRVLYLAVTRAHQLAAIALPRRYIPGVAAMLSERRTCRSTW